MKRKSIIILLIIIAIFIVGMIFYSDIEKLFTTDSNVKSSNVIGGQNKSTLRVDTQVLEYETLDDFFKTKGLLLPDEEVDLSFETSGKITNIYFKEGTSVSKGDLLAKVNDQPLQAELKKLEAQLPLAEERVFRQKTLLEKDAVSQESYQSVTTELEKLKADIELVKSKITQTELRAPFDGIVGLRSVSEGTFATPSVIVAKLIKTAPLKIEFSVNEKQANSIKQGTKLKFSIENDFKEYYAEVYAVENKLDITTLSLKARALFPNENNELKPGHSAEIEINLKKNTNTIVIPSVAIVAEMGVDVVYTYNNGIAKRNIVTKGMRTASSVQIIQGLKIGDTLITSGVMQLRDGTKVLLN